MGPIRALMILVVVSLSAAACGSGGDDGADVREATTTEETGATCPDEGEDFADAKLYIEHNATDEDTGVHALFAAEGWTELCVLDPEGNHLVVASPQGPLGDLGLADLFWESREPENDEYSIDDLRADFPEGEYRVAGTDHEGHPLAGTAHFTHTIPAAPQIVAPAGLAEDEDDAADVVIGPDDVVVAWEAVDTTIDGEPVTITAYEVIVTDDAFEDPDGFAKPVYDVHVGPDVTSLSVPSEFFSPDTLYEVEVLALEESGNQTITIGFFRTP